jgi:hypothetical protein
MVLTQGRRTEPAQSAASGGNSPASPARRFAARHAGGVATLAVLAVSLASAGWFTRSFYYFQDDFIFIRQAQLSSLSLGYLRSSLFQHFSPVSRLADYVLAHWFHSSVAAAHTIELVLLAASVLAFSWAIAELVGRHWWRHLLTLAFAESLALLHLLGWWTATANILPATLFGLLTIAAFLRYRRLGDRRWIVISLLSYGLSLCTHEQSWLVLGYLILFDLLVFAPHGRLRDALVRLWRESWVWFGYGLLTVLAMINYFAFYYAPVQPRATVGELIRYVGIQFTQSFAPSAMGLRPLTTGWTNTGALVFDSLLFAVIVMVSIYRRPSAWRVWTVFAVGFLANSVMIGANRVGYYGVDFGQELYYLQSPAYLFLLCVGAAFSLDRSGAPYVLHQGVSEHPRVPTHLRQPSQRWVCIRRVSVCLLAVGLYEVAFVTSATSLNVKDLSNQESAAARVYFTRLLGQIDAASSHGGQVAVLDTAVPAGIIASGFAPWNQLRYALPVVRPDVGVDQLREATFDVAPDGALVPMRFQRTSGTSRGLPVAAVVGSSGATPTRATSRPVASHLAVADGPCFSSTRPGGTIHVRLVSPLSTPDAWLLVRLTSSSGGSVKASTASNGVPAPVGTIDLATASQTNDYLLPLSQRTFDQVELSAATAGQDLCVSSIDVGTFSPSRNDR